MTKPWFKFYPTNWRADTALRLCSPAARGLWIEMVCIMGESDPCGYLLVKGNQITNQQLAVLACIPPQDIDALLAELEQAGVFHRKRNGTIYCRRMVRSEREREEQSARSRQRLLPDFEQEFDFGDGVESRDQNLEPKKTLHQWVEEIWASTPAQGRARSGKADVRRALEAAVNRRKNPARIAAALAAYYASHDATKDNAKWAKGLHRMIEQDRWEAWSSAEVVSIGPSPVMQRRWMQDWIEHPNWWKRGERGPTPAEEGCVIAAEIMAEFGYSPPARRAG